MLCHRRRHYPHRGRVMYRIMIHEVMVSLRRHVLRKKRKERSGFTDWKSCDTFVDPFKVLTSVAPAQYPLSETGTGNIWRYSKGNTVERRIRLTHRIGGRETVQNYKHSRSVACMLTKSLNSCCKCPPERLFTSVMSSNQLWMTTRSRLTPTTWSYRCSLSLTNEHSSSRGSR